jgi:predicted Fe-S protein YdhL (DUF1289 family)
MAFFPKIQSPCPYKSDLAAVMDGDMCRMCNRQVFDLSEMGDDQRRAFLSACSGQVCVSYKFPIRPALAAMAVAAMAVPTAAAAQEDEIALFVGGIHDPANVEYIEDAADAALPELPVVYEDAKAKQAPAATITAPDAS